MSASKDLERRLAAHFTAEAPSRGPDWVLARVLETIDTTPQRRVLVRVPWRAPRMSMYAKLAAAALTVVALGVIGLAVLSSGGTPVNPTPTSTPTSTPGARPSPSPVPSQPPALTQTYTSVIHGISIGHPAGWSASPATEPWSSGPPSFDATFGDHVYDAVLTDHLFLSLYSQPLAGTSAAEWTAARLAERGAECARTEPVSVGTASGVLGVDCLVALASRDGRGYVISLYRSSDEPRLADVYDLAWFREVLDTVGFRRSSADFQQPFSHTLPAGVVFDLGQDYGPAYLEVRIPAAAEAGTPSGLIAQAIGGGRADPCTDPSAPASIGAGPQAVVDYLGTIPELSVAGVAPTTVSGLPAVEATVTVEPTAACPAIWAWTESPESMPDGTPLRLIAVDVGGEHVVLTVYGEAANPAWDTMADELIGSIRFDAG